MHFDSVIEKLKVEEQGNCCVCLDQIEDAVITICMHYMCRYCLVRSIEARNFCPLCRRILTKEDFMTVPR